MKRSSIIYLGVVITSIISMPQGDIPKPQTVSAMVSECLPAYIPQGIDPSQTSLGGMSRVMELYYEQEPSKEETTQAYLASLCSFSEEEISVLLQLVQAEIGDGTMEQKRNVTDVILNRMKSKQFPDTIKEVAFQREPCIQFSVMLSGGRYWTQQVTHHTVLAVAKALQEYPSYNAKGALYFVMSGYDSSFHESLKYLFSDGAHDFYTE